MPQHSYVVPARVASAMLKLTIVMLSTQACADNAAGPAPPPDSVASLSVARTAPPQQINRQLLETVSAGAHRTADDRALDAARRPADAFAFLGADPRMTIVELAPADDYYAAILAPFIRYGEGVYYRAHETDNAAAADRARWAEVDKAVFGNIRIMTISEIAGNAKHPGADIAFIARRACAWRETGGGPAALGALDGILRSGGVLAFIETRADATAAVSAAEAAGYQLEAGLDGEITVSAKEIADASADPCRGVEDESGTLVTLKFRKAPTLE
ncbi:MAG: hypothetical protein ACKVS5_09875 [Parvularculaceae bacterium]